MTSNTYGALNSSYFAANGYSWPADQGDGPTAEMLAIALAMPSVEPSGARSKRGGLKSPGLGTYYHAATMQWQRDVTQGCVDRTVFDAWRSSPDKGPGDDSNKQNHLTGLVSAGLIQRYRVGNTWQTALTDAGVAHVASINRELGKVAKGFTVAARDKALKAAEKAMKQADKPVKAKPAKAKRQPGETYQPTPADTEAGIEPYTVPADQQQHDGKQQAE